MMIEFILIAYGGLSLLRFLLQLSCAHVHHHRRLRSGDFHESNDRPLPRISVIYPIYNENPDILRLVMKHAACCLEIPEIEFIFVDDGSPNRAELAPIYTEFEGPRLRIVHQDNAGKRRAQCRGLGLAAGEVIVTVDSDTLIDVSGLRRLVRPLLSDPCIGAVCGDVVVKNSDVNLLTMLQSPRYWTAFNVERAAQSLFQSVLCCSGPFSAYRAEVFKKVEESYRTQRFCGRECTYGDDRHLTNLVLGEGRRVVFRPGAVAWTYVPETLGEYVSQQNRWNKSFYREILWTLRIADRVHPYSLIDMILQPALFVLSTLALSNCLLLLVTTPSWKLVAGILGTIILGAFMRVAYGLWRTKDVRFLIFVLYGLLHVFVLTPVRFKSLMTLNDTRWGTRSVQARNGGRDFAIWAGRYLAVVAVGACMIYALSRTAPAEDPPFDRFFLLGRIERAVAPTLLMLSAFVVALSAWLLAVRAQSRALRS